MLKPPTASPTTSGGLNVWYADYDSDFAVATCINAAPLPNGRPTYTSQLACCQAEYKSQLSGACLTKLPSRPTSSPTKLTGLDVWYPKYDEEWLNGYCTNAAPIPNGRPTYKSELACCQGAYAGQASGACLRELPSPPTSSPTGEGGFFYPVYGTSGYEKSYCDNAPAGVKPWFQVGSTLFVTQVQCCKKWFPNQPGDFCLRREPTFGTISPTVTPVYLWYPGASFDMTISVDLV